MYLVLQFNLISKGKLEDAVFAVADIIDIRNTKIVTTLKNSVSIFVRNTKRNGKVKRLNVNTYIRQAAVSSPITGGQTPCELICVDYQSFCNASPIPFEPCL